MPQNAGQKTAVREQTPAPEVTVAGSNASPPATVPDDGGKVALDIEDAPFLQQQEEKKREEPDDKPAEAPEEPSPEDLAKKKKKKLLLIAGAAALLLVVIAAAVWWFFFRTPALPPPEPPAPTVIIVPSKPAAPPSTPDIAKDFAPFIVPLGESPAKDTFLICKFTTVTKDPQTQAEQDRKMIVLRDAIYFFLKSKSADFLMDARNAEAIKKELLGVLNGYLSTGKLDDVLFESYLDR